MPETIKNPDEAPSSPEPHPLENMPSFEEHIEQDVDTVAPVSEASEAPKAKTWQEKAKEKNYYQDENGDWWQKSDDENWGDENVSSFKLDVEYPDLADTVARCAEEIGIELYDSDRGLKQKIYDRAARLSQLNPGTIDDMFSILGSITTSTYGTEDIVLSRNERNTRGSLERLNQFYDGLSNEVKSSGLKRSTGQIAETFIRNYDENLATDGFMEHLSRGASLAQTDQQAGPKLAGIIKNGIAGFSKNKCDGDLFGDYLDFVLELLPDDQKITNYESKSRLFERYVEQHGFTKDTVSGFKEVIFPLLENHDAEVVSIISGGNAYGVGEYDYGIADYTEECLLSRCNPQSIDKLNRIYHEIPTSDYHRFEQNRQDAARLQGTIIGGRDFIHDERPGVHEILSTMEQYYDADSPASREQARQHLIELDDKYPYNFLENALKLENYDQKIEKMSEEYVGRARRGQTAGSPEETAADILRRLVKNTAPDEIHPPTTKYDKLNQLMDNIHPSVNSKTGEVRVSMDEVGPAITGLNHILLERQGEQGVFPSTISAVSYLDKMAANVLRGFDRRDILEGAYDPKFKEILRFSELTSSTGYSDSGFDHFYQQACDKFGKAYGANGVDLDEVRSGWRFIGTRITNNMSNLAKVYAAKSSTRRFVDTVWSGNLSHELIGMFEKV